ncbi:hypothetical protein NQL31_004291 [Lotmaria passim]
MSKKRTRMSMDVLGDLDELFGISEVHSPVASALDDENGSSYPDNQNSPLRMEKTANSSTNSLSKRRRVSCSTDHALSSPRTQSADTNASAFSNTATINGLGGDEINLLCRKDEAMADMALFLAKAVGEAPSPLSLRELVTFLEKSGVSRMLLALKRAEATEAFVHSLFLAQPTLALRVLLLRLFFEFLLFADVEVFFQRSVVAFLVESLMQPDGAEANAAATASAASATPSPTRGALHWSVRPKRVSPSSPSTSSNSSSLLAESSSDNDELLERVEALCTSISFDHSSSCVVTSSPSTIAFASSAPLSLQALLTLLFQYNRSLLSASPATFSLPLAFAHAGGLERVSGLLRDASTREAALALLEVVTASEALRREKARLLPLVPTLVRHLSTATAPTVQVSVLKVLTNITNLLPSALSETSTATSFVGFLPSVFSYSATDVEEVEERETFALCCAINVVKYEARDDAGVQPTFTVAFMQRTELLPALEKSMTGRYHCSEAEQLVLSGYAALLLGALSLVDVPGREPPSLRVPVMTAVATASRGTRIGRLTDRQPMRMVAAIIQEFLLFQSTAGTLTKEALMEMDALVDRIRQRNHIAVAPPADFVAAAAACIEKDDNADEVTLGDLL